MKKGFTLVELLAVIVILGVLALIIVPNVAGTLKNQKNNLYKVQISNIEAAAQGWASENFFRLPTEDDDYITIYLKDLVGLIDTDITNPKTNEKFGQCLVINITKVAGTENYTYKVQEDTINNNEDCKSNIGTTIPDDDPDDSDEPNKDDNPSLAQGWVVPTGCTYYMDVTSKTIGYYTGATATYTGGQKVTKTASTGDVFVCGDYEYRYNMELFVSDSRLHTLEWGLNE